jgi:Coenzyme PQQ synthesis protein D (PqqD)
MLLHERFPARRDLEGQGNFRGAAQMLTFRDRGAVPAHVLVRILDRESVLLNLETERYFGLDETGTRMWQLVTASQDIEAAYQELLAEYDVEPELLRTNLTDLLGQLVENGLLQVLPADVGKTAAL